MLVFWRQRLVFLATPKTGSTSIESALAGLAALAVPAPPELKHMDAGQYRRHLAPWLAESAGAGFTSVALMREPRDWLSSWHRTRQRADEAQATSTRGVDFDAFVRAWCSADPPPYARLRSQAAFLAPEGAAPVDHIFRYEAIEDFVHFLEDRLDCALTLPRLNVSPPGEARLSPGTAALLHEHAVVDFALYARLGAGAEALV